MGMLSNYKALDRDPPKIDIDTSLEVKRELALELLASGDKVTHIAKYLGVSRTAIYNWKKESEQDHFNFLASQTYFELFASDLKWIGEEIGRYEQMSTVLYDAIVERNVDSDGKVTASLGSTAKVRDYNDCRRVTKDLKKMKAEILASMTLKNKDGDPNVHGKIADKNVIEEVTIPKLAHEENVIELVRLLELEKPTLKNK